MRQSINVRLLLIGLLLVPTLMANGAHQVGGQLEMQAIGDTPGRYRIIVTNYFEAGPRADAQTGGQLAIYRKRDNALMLSFAANVTGQRKPLIFTNAYCAELRQLNFILVTYGAEVQLNLANYTDSQGYYISYQSGYRNGGINNIKDPAFTGFTYYLEFPALLQNGQPIRFSSPHFPTINGEYICLGEPFSSPFNAVDPDGDELRYSMVTPLNQGAEHQLVAPGPYPGVDWLPGFGPYNAIPGYPALSIDAKTGVLSVTANRVGLFVFGVKVEKYRNGKKLGEVRRDFQFLVVDCAPTAIPPPAVQIQNQASGTRAITLCQGGSVILQTTDNPDQNYQWQQNGSNIATATQASLRVHESGDYSVVVSSKNACLKPGTSQPVTVRIATLNPALKRSGTLCSTSGSVQLKATADSAIHYQWYANGLLLPNETTNSLKVDREGQYWAVATQTPLGCTFTTDTASISRMPVIPATIRSMNGMNKLCSDDSLLLESSPALSYSWERDSQRIQAANSEQYWATTAGSYVVSTVDSNGCPQISDAFVIEQIPAITVLFDSISPVCDSSITVIPLSGSPPGGEFSGTGVVGTDFYPEQAGTGNHQLTYSVRAAPECAGTVATQTIAVGVGPTVNLPDSILIPKGSSFRLNPSVGNDAISFLWSPATYLDNPTIANPSVLSVNNDIAYTLRVSSRAGCHTDATVHVLVIDQIWVPDAFTPNGDGMNDVLVLPGIRVFPKAVITIFNRWGEVVYRSQPGYTDPFDGTQHGRPLPAGLYTYHLTTGTDLPPINGTIMLLRK
ncbi:gliding motility-associated C-terminal domain-containing protein [Spirosoma sp. SC4-14]|uniref:gliding motility-associated C-terminal domain-containing protein n=1 Tax=Spirosoma sp. SC4-14 TaxID=3128900 RepID=UPI0030CEDE26